MYNSLEIWYNIREEVGVCLKNYERCTLEKIAVVEMKANELVMNLAQVQKNKSYVIYKEVSMPVKVAKDLEKEELLKQNIIKEIISVLEVFKQIADKEGVVDTIAIASNVLKKAKNLNGFLNEVQSKTSFKFNILEAEEEMNYSYMATINSFNKPKGLMVNISDYNVELMLFNRRNVLESKILPFGVVSLAEQFPLDKEDSNEKMISYVKEQVADLNWAFDLEEEFNIIGAGQVFRDLGQVSRRARRYPIDVEHNYTMNMNDFNKVYDVVKQVDFSKPSKIKGVVSNPAYLMAGLNIISVIFNKANKDELSISKLGVKEGLILNYAIPLTLEKPISDNLGYSLQVINEYYDKEANNSEQIYNLSMILFKQLKVLHKLGRNYVRVLRVASYLQNVGYRVNYSNVNRNAFDIILNSEIYGVTHSELVLACFTSLLVDPDNFTPAMWVKYKDLVTDEDLDAIKKLAVMLRIAKSLDVTEFGNITDITCDILGDSVIMKTVSDKIVDFEVKHAMRWGGDFKKAFGKNLEIL